MCTNYQNMYYIVVTKGIRPYALGQHCKTLPQHLQTNNKGAFMLRAQSRALQWQRVHLPRLGPSALPPAIDAPPHF
eukprot:COSAG02_NODE_693_length_18428_cov_268.516722_15_plen_76_part_00